MSLTKDTIKNKKGFTLIELILSVTLFGVVIAISLNFYMTGYKIYQVENERLFAQQNVRQAFVWLSSTIRQADSVKIIENNKISILTSNQEIVVFYLKNGVLYREKNKGVNPIAELTHLTINQYEENCIDLCLSLETENDVTTLETKVTPFGAWID